MVFCCDLEDKEVVVEKAVKTEDMEMGGEEDDYSNNSKAAYEKFIEDLKSLTDGFTDCRYAVFDFKFQGTRQGAGASKMDKIIFIQLYVIFHCNCCSYVEHRMVIADSHFFEKKV